MKESKNIITSNCGFTVLYNFNKTPNAVRFIKNALSKSEGKQKVKLLIKLVTFFPLKIQKKLLLILMMLLHLQNKQITNGTKLMLYLTRVWHSGTLAK